MKFSSLLACGLLLAAPLANAADASPDAAIPAPSIAAAPTSSAAASTRSGAEIYARFRDGLADPECSASDTSRWRSHFAHAPRHLTDQQRDVLPLFGYVVDELIAAGLPTEYALIPFVESGYRPDARSPSGPAGMWQFIALTARNQGIPMREGFDGRYSPVESTQAAVRYLRTLHGMFGGNWELTVMGYNAGENRILGSIRRSGQRVGTANPAQLDGVPEITRSYVRKLHALACILTEAEERPQFRTAMQRQVPIYTAVSVSQDTRSLDEFANRNGLNAQSLRRMNPVYANRLPARSVNVLAPANSRNGGAAAQVAGLSSRAASNMQTSANPRRHTVSSGDTLGALARRYGVPVAELLRRNSLSPASILRPGQVLRVDD